MMTAMVSLLFGRGAAAWFRCELACQIVGVARTCVIIQCQLSMHVCQAVVAGRLTRQLADVPCQAYVPQGHPVIDRRGLLGASKCIVHEFSDSNLNTR